ncbi:unnamed protein product [Calypogeia fissa]
MGVVSYTLSGPTGRNPIKSQNNGANVKAISQMSRRRKPGHKLLTMILIMISLCTFQCCASEVAGNALPFTAPPPPPHNRTAPAPGPEAPKGHAPSPIGKLPQHSPPPKLPKPPTAAPTQSDPSEAGQLVQFQQVLSSLRVNNYTIGAQYISDYLFLLPLDSTLFVPTNAAFGGVKTDVDASTKIGPMLAYHAILQQLSYQKIGLLPVGTRFATLIANNNTVEITSIAPDDLRVDDVRVVQRDVCNSDTLALQISCHGIDGILNMTEWGGSSLALNGPRVEPPVASPALSPPPSPKLAPPRGRSPPVESPSPLGSTPSPRPV